MINPANLTNADIGREVIYTDAKLGIQESGTLTSWGELFVFVRFRGPDGEACLPESVSFAHAENGGTQ